MFWLCNLSDKSALLDYAEERAFLTAGVEISLSTFKAFYFSFCSAIADAGGKRVYRQGTTGISPMSTEILTLLHESHQEESLVSTSHGAHASSNSCFK